MREMHLIVGNDDTKGLDREEEPTRDLLICTGGPLEVVQWPGEGVWTVQSGGTPGMRDARQGDSGVGGGRVRSVDDYSLRWPPAPNPQSTQGPSLIEPESPTAQPVLMPARV